MEGEKISKEAQQLLKNDEFKKRVPRLRSFLEAIKKLNKASKAKEVTLTEIIKDHYSEKLNEKIGEDEKYRFISRHRPQISRVLKELDEDWGLIVKSLAREDGKVKVVNLTPLGMEILDYDDKHGINTLKRKKSTSTEEEIPLSAIQFHSTKLRKLVVERLLNDFPIVKKDGIFDPSEEYKNARYTGGEFLIEDDEVLLQDFLENHLEFTTSKDFITLLDEFKEIAREWSQAYDTVIKGIKLDLELHFELPYFYQDESKGFTKNLVDWIIEGMKCHMDPDCNKYYFKKYFVDRKNSEVIKTKSGNKISLEYRNERGCLIFEEEGKKQKVDFKVNNDKKIKEFMEKKLHKAPFYKMYKKKIAMLSKAEELRNDIIRILKMNLQIPLFKVGNCPYLKVMVPDIQKRSNDR